MKRIFLSVLFSILLCTVISAAASAKDYTANTDNTYTVEITGKTPGQYYSIVVVAGDYTDKTTPEFSESNIIYIDQVTADDDGVVSFTAFIPMTDSVGTIYIGGDDDPTTEGVLMTDSGLGYDVAGKLISYTGNEETLIIPENITSIGTGVIDENDSVKNVVFKNGAEIVFADNAFANGTKLFFSPLATAAKEYAIANNLTYAFLGDSTGDNAVNVDDYIKLLSIFAGVEEITQVDFNIILDLDFNNDVNFRDLSVLLQFVGDKINDYYEAFNPNAN